MNLSNQEDKVIADLSTAMKFKFMVHRSKGGWDSKDLERLFSELTREMSELKAELNEYQSGESSAEKVISECADVANYLAMIIEKVKK